MMCAMRYKYQRMLRLRKVVFEFCCKRCVYCGSNKNLTIDHFVPRKRCRMNDWENLLCACKSCNGVKKDRLFESVYECIKYIRRAKGEFVTVDEQWYFETRENWLRNLPATISPQAQVATFLHSKMPDYSFLEEPVGKVARPEQVKISRKGKLKRFYTEEDIHVCTPEYLRSIGAIK